MTDTRESEAAAAKPSRWRLWLFSLLAVLVLLPVMLVGVLLLALRSDTGTAWVMEQVPGLKVTQGQGSLLGQWQAERLEWQGFGVGVDARSPLVRWSPGCLFGKELCLDQLEADAIDVTLASPGSGDGQPAPISLPTLDLPLSVTIGLVALGPLTLDGQEIWDRFRFSASGSGASWAVSQLSVQRQAMSLDVSGRLETRGDWPLDLDVLARIPPPEGEQWLLDLNLTGSVADLQVRGDSRGYLDASVSGGLAPLDPALPARLQLQTRAFKATGALPDTLTLLNTDLGLEGSLEKGFRLNGQGQLPGTEGQIGFSLKSLVTTTGAEDIALVLTGQGTGDAGTGTASVRGKVSWDQALAADARFTLNAFPWFNLLPGVEPPPVVLNQLSGDLDYQDGSYSATLEAVVDGPQGKADLASNIAGDLESLTLSGLRVSTGAGSLEGEARVGFAGPVTWQTTLNLNQFNPGYWVPALEASLDGEVTSAGRLDPEGGDAPSIQAAWNLAGSWRASEASIRGSLDQSGEALMLSDLELLVGDNRIAGSGQWGPELGGEFQLDLPQPQSVLPRLEGAFTGRVSVSGTPDAPLGSLALTGQAVGWEGQAELARFDLSASLASGERIKADLTASELAAAGQALDSLSVVLSGTRDDHRLEINAIHEEARLLLSFAGTLGSAWSTWTGQLAQGKIDVAGQDQFWRLNQPAALTYSEAGQLTFGQHCWQWQEATVCAGQQTLLPEPVLDYRVRNFPTTALAPVLPEALRWDTLLDADLSFQASGPTGGLSVDAGDGEFSVLNGDEWETFKYNALTSRIELLPERADLAFRLEGPRLGTLSADVSVDPQSEARNLDGSFRIADLDIALAAVFAGLEEVRGQINGQGRISGPLVKPAVNGQVAMTGGAITDPSLPLPLQDIVFAVELNGYQADLSGRWKSNERGSGELDGRASWENGPELSLSLTGQRLPVLYDPYASVELEPDLQIDFGPDGLSLSGRVGVPRGEITITELPAQAVSVSEDEVIVGANQPQEAPPLALNLDITVVVGEDQVSFNGFEVTGNLEGTLRIGNGMDTRGSLRLIDGRYEAYGQELELRRARLLFTGPLSQPYLDIEAVRRVDTVIAGIRLSGPVSAPQTEVFSEPSMPQTDALSYLVLGRSPQAQTQGDEGQMRNAAISLGLNQAAGITRGVGDELGIRDLTLEAEGSGDQAAVVASGYLTEDLSLRYGVGLFEPITTVALRYDLGRYFYLEAASGLAASLDVFYTRDF